MIPSHDLGAAADRARRKCGPQNIHGAQTGLEPARRLKQYDASSADQQPPP
jgi:hypothetical protein